MTIEAGVGLFFLGGIVTILCLGIAYYYVGKEKKDNNEVSNPLKDLFKK